MVSVRFTFCIYYMFLPSLLHLPCALLSVSCCRRWSNKGSNLKDPWRFSNPLQYLFIKIVSILLAIFWQQQISWSYLCRQSKIRSRGMTPFQQKGHIVRKTLPCLWCNGYVLQLLCQCFSVRLSPCRLCCFFLCIFSGSAEVTVGIGLRLRLG